MTRTACVLLAALLLLTSSAEARRRRRRRVRRDRFTNTLSLGTSTGLGSPLGFGGIFLEYRPVRVASLQGGVGAGGTFGPAVAVGAFIDPITTRGWALGVGGALSHNFSYASGPVVPGRPSLPSSTNWGSIEIQTHFRPSRRVFVRIGFGRTFLFDSRAFRVASTDELERARLPVLPFATPLDAVRAAARDEPFSMWYFHLDIAGIWRL